MSKKTTTEDPENQQEATEQTFEHETGAESVGQAEDGSANVDAATEDINEALASLVADGEVLLTADSIESLNEKFDKVKASAFDKNLAAGAISHDIDNEVYVLQVNVIN